MSIVLETAVAVVLGVAYWHHLRIAAVVAPNFDVAADGSLHIADGGDFLESGFRGSSCIALCCRRHVIIHSPPLLRLSSSRFRLRDRVGWGFYIFDSIDSTNVE